MLLRKLLAFTLTVAGIVMLASGIPDLQAECVQGDPDGCCVEDWAHEEETGAPEESAGVLTSVCSLAGDGHTCKAVSGACNKAGETAWFSCDCDDAEEEGDECEQQSSPTNRPTNNYLYECRIEDMGDPAGRRCGCWKRLLGASGNTNSVLDCASSADTCLE